MNLSINYYSILGVRKDSSETEIKKSYYKLAMKFHPDKGGDAAVFSEMTEAYDVLCSDSRKDYDIKSKFGACYNEYFELFEINAEFDYGKAKSERERFKKNDVLDIYVKVGDDFSGVIEYERWVRCKACDGSGKDLSSKIVIRDNDGNVLKVFDGEDGCDICEGSGEYMGQSCPFCDGNGKVGMNPCPSCKGDRRILGRQKLKGISLEGESTRIEAMGHLSKTEAGRVGSLFLIRS
jgi:DnaJ-class molecular chaperone